MSGRLDVRWKPPISLREHLLLNEHLLSPICVVSCVSVRSRFESRGKIREHQKCVKEFLEAQPWQLNLLECFPSFPSASNLNERSADAQTSWFITFSMPLFKMSNFQIHKARMWPGVNSPVRFFTNMKRDRCSVAKCFSETK